MHLNACFAFLFLCVALIQAGPAPKTVEKKSLAEDAKAETKKEDLKIEETGEDKDRSKKSTFCVHIGPETSQPGQVAWKDTQMSAQKIPLTLHTQPLPQQVQTLNVVQPVAQTVPQASVVMPQQMVQPVHTLQIVQSPPQPCAQSAPAVNIIQPPPQSTIIKTVQKTKPKPVEAETIPVTEEPKPMRVEQLPEPLPEPEETLTVLPVAPPCHDHLITIPSSSMMLVSEPEQPQLAAFVQLPSMLPCSNPLHGFLNPCPCQQNIAMAGVEPMAMKMLPVAPYSSAFAKSPLVLPYDSKTLSQIMVNDNVDKKLSSQARRHGYIKMKIPSHAQLSQQTIYQNMHVQGLEGAGSPYMNRGLVDNPYATKRITINAFPETLQAVNPSYRLADGSFIGEESESSNHVHPDSRKIPRETDSNPLSPENAVEAQQEDGRALLIDGRRNARSSKEKTKESEQKSKAN